MGFEVFLVVTYLEDLYYRGLISTAIIVVYKYLEPLSGQFSHPGLNRVPAALQGHPPQIPQLRQLYPGFRVLGSSM